MQITTLAGPVTVLSVIGDIDTNTYRELIDTAEGILYKGYAKLVLDLSGVNYMSSAGVVALQTITGRAAGHGGKAVLCSLTNKVQEVLELSGINQTLSIFTDLVAAKESFDAG